MAPVPPDIGIVAKLNEAASAELVTPKISMANMSSFNDCPDTEKYFFINRHYSLNG
jgi:hypothetical protein